MQVSPTPRPSLLRLDPELSSCREKDEDQHVHSQDTTVTANKEALDGVALTSRGCFDFFFSIWRARLGSNIYLNIQGTLNALSGLGMNTEF